MLARLFCAAVVITGATVSAGSQFVDVTPTLVLPSMSGQDIFRYYCTACHGRNGRGDGPVAAALKTKPADLTRLASLNGGQFPRERVQAFVAHGRTDAPAHGAPDMPIWGPIFQTLDQSDKVAQVRVDNVVAYVQSIQRK